MSRKKREVRTSFSVFFLLYICFCFSFLLFFFLFSAAQLTFYTSPSGLSLHFTTFARTFYSSFNVLESPKRPLTSDEEEGPSLDIHLICHTHTHTRSEKNLQRLLSFQWNNNTDCCCRDDWSDRIINVSVCRLPLSSVCVQIHYFCSKKTSECMFVSVCVCVWCWWIESFSRVCAD